MRKIAIIASHPIQYYSPWFKQLAVSNDLLIKVFYLWNFGVTDQFDVGFQRTIQWDTPLLTGYDYEFVPNVSTDPGTRRFWGLINPSLIKRVYQFEPNAVLLIGYNYASIWEFVLRSKSHRVPLILKGDSHRLIPGKGVLEIIRKWAISSIFKRFAAFLYVGGANQKYYLYHHVPKGQLFFSPHSVDNSCFLNKTDEALNQAVIWKKELGIPEHHLVILFAGKFEKKKRPLDLLAAFLSAGLSDASLLFVGSGELQGELLSKSAGYSDIFFAPFQNQSLMPRTYAIADLFVLPSFGPGETWGLAINEAMCMSLPIIVSSHVGCSQDLVRPYENGLIFPAGDVRALVSALKEAVSDKKRLKKWGKKSSEMIASYSYEEATKGLMGALDFLGK